ncbi:hypothetical protein D3C87_1474440 [compost metagenome]
MQGKAQAEGDAGLHLRSNALRVHRDPAIDCTDHAMYADRQVVLGHLGDLRHITTKRLMHRHAQGMAVRQRRFPIGFFHRKVQHAQVSRMLLEQCPPVLHRVFARRAGQFIDQRFHDKRRMTVPHRPQPQHTDAGFR